MDPVTIPAKFKVRSFMRSWDNTGVLKKIGRLWIRPRSLFSKIFLWACVRMDPVNISVKFEVPSFRRSWDNSDCSFGAGCEPPI